MFNKYQVHLGDKNEVNKEIQKLSQQTQSQQLVSTNLLEDPSLYDYDGFVSKKNKNEKAVVIQKQSVNKEKKLPQYLNSVLEQSKKREFERQAIQSRMNAKETLKSGKEVYITDSFKQKHEQIKRYEQIEQIQEKINDESRKRNNLGIYKSLYDNESKKGENQHSQVDSYKIIEKIITEQEKQKVSSQITQNHIENNQLKLESDELEKNQKIINKNELEQVANSKSRSRSRSQSIKEQKKQENEGLTKEEKLKQYKERYLQRKQQ
ncbi:unnamed protein product [Paramecium sonneborni]|uniref:Nuclear speckle splicing regulatory protein 1 N-terminal domain-containing protein n=1 Tax=Paramecium sonneborni TaxID=65129 RepID=A0A8S1KNV9_9CILI|nr:unnamed protein product [Paramecium sonneborni]